MLKISRFVLICGILAIVVTGAAACSSTPAPTINPDEIEAIRAYADPATRTALEGLSENDLAKYTEFANTEFKDAVTQEVFDTTSAQINSQLGDFISITFLSIEYQDPYTIVHYRAVYAKGETGVRMVFDNDHLIAGQWFE